MHFKQSFARCWAAARLPRKLRTGNLHLINGLYDGHRSRFRCWRSLQKSPARKSAPATFKKPIRNASSRNAATAAPDENHNNAAALKEFLAKDRFFAM